MVAEGLEVRVARLEERMADLEERLTRMNINIHSVDKKVWALVVLMIANLAGMMGTLLVILQSPKI